MHAPYADFHRVPHDRHVGDVCDRPGRHMNWRGAMELNRTSLIALVAVMFLTACGPLPRPFGRSASDEQNGLAQQIYFEGVEVQPISGTSRPMGELLAEAVAKQLEREYELPAALEDFDRSQYVLSGVVQSNQSKPGKQTLYSIEWALFARNGEEIWRHTQDVPGNQIDWDYGAPTLLDAVGISIGAMVARAVLGERFGQDGGDRLLGRQGTILGDVRGAPGDGNAALKRAMSVALGGGGVNLVTDPKQALFTVGAVVDVGLPEKNAQSVRIVWSVTDIDGKVIGRAEQANVVPAGSLDGRWGQTAAFVAAAAMDGIIQVIKRHDPNAQRVPNLGAPNTSPTRGSEPLVPSPDLRQVPGRAPPPPPS